MTRKMTGVTLLFPMNLQTFNDGGIDGGEAGQPDTPVPAPEGNGVPKIDQNLPDNGAQQPQQPQNPDSDFARMRRAMEQQFQNSPEYRLAKTLSERYGRNVEEILQELEEQALQDQASRLQVPPEILRQQQETQAQLLQLQEEIARQRILSEVEKFRASDTYKSATEDQLHNALSLLGRMHKAGFTDYTLEQAFNAANPEFLKEQIRQQIIKEYSGNSQAALPPQSGQPVPLNAKNAWEMSDDKFQELLERVKSGEKITRL